VFDLSPAQGPARRIPGGRVGPSLDEAQLSAWPAHTEKPWSENGKKAH
jgi:hypothetical protein